MQETYARWYAMSRERQEAIESPGAWLTTVAARVCLDLLGSARVRRERYVGEWIPEPLPDRTEWITGPAGGGAEPADCADWVTLDESVSMAFLVVLESMTSAERVAFLLHDVFRYPFAEVAEMVGRTPVALPATGVVGPSTCSRRAGSGGSGVRAGRSGAELQRGVEARYIEALVDLLDPDATMIADGGGMVGTVLRPVQGSERIAQYLIHIAGKAPGLTLLERTVNGRPDLVAQHAGVTVTVAASSLTDARITRIWAVRNPEKLRPWTENGQTDPAS